MSTSELTSPGYWDQAVAGYEAMASPFTAHFARAALRGIAIDRETRVLDVATGTGAFAIEAHKRGASVLAVDFAAGMVARVKGLGLPGVEARQMDGQMLDLPDAAFDVVGSIFGVMLFQDWQAGLREMARVTRPGGTVVVAVWKHPQGAATNLLLAEVGAALLPDIAQPLPSVGMGELSDPARLRAALIVAGCNAPAIVEETHDFQLPLAALEDLDRLFGSLPFWQSLTPPQRRQCLSGMQGRAERDAAGGFLPVPSTALIATAVRS